MGHSDAIAQTGWRALVVQVGLLVVSVFSVMILFSRGSQLVVAPALLPAQWLIARHSRGMVSLVFRILGGLLVVEVVWLTFALLTSNGTALVGLGVPGSLLAGYLYYRSARPGTRQ